MRVSMSRKYEYDLTGMPLGTVFSSQEVTICLPYHFYSSSFLLVKTHVWMQSLTAVSGEIVNTTQKIQYPSPDLNQNFASSSSWTTVLALPRHATKTCAHERRTKNLGFTFKQDSTPEEFEKYKQAMEWGEEERAWLLVSNGYFFFILILSSSSGGTTTVLQGP